MPTLIQSGCAHACDLYANIKSARVCVLRSTLIHISSLLLFLLLILLICCSFLFSYSLINMYFPICSLLFCLLYHHLLSITSFAVLYLLVSPTSLSFVDSTLLHHLIQFNSSQLSNDLHWYDPSAEYRLNIMNRR